MTDERLARIEEKQDAMKDDISELKTTSKETNALLLAMSKQFLSKDEAKDMRDERKREMEDINGRVRKLEGWRNWLTGAYVVGAGIIVLLFEYGKQWVTGGGHP